MPLPLRRAHTAAAVLLAIVVVLCVPVVAHAAAQPRLIVGFTPTASTAQQARALGRSVRTKGRVRALRAVIVEAAPGRLAATRARLLSQPGVAYVEIDGVAHAYDLDADAQGGVAAHWRPSDTFLSQQWGIATIGAEAAWERSRGTGTTIAIVDTGVDYIHPDLSGRVDLGRDFVDSDDDPMDVQGHGTHVAGIAAGNTDDGFGVAGVAPAARLLAVRVLDAKGTGNYSHVAQGIVYASQHQAKIINLSLGGPEKSEILRAAIDYAAARGAVVTCASGNNGARSLGYPARYNSCLAVGASDQSDAVATFSNRGPGLDIVAPGAGILSSVMGGSHDSWDGTSMATPFVSGTAALLFAQGLHRREVLAALTSTARDVAAPGADTASGAGRLDAAAATEAASRTPRAATDTVKPTVARLTVLAPRRSTVTTSRFVWKVVRRTGFRRVGTSTFEGTYAYSKTATRGTTRTTSTIRYAGGIVYRRIVVQKRVRQVRRTVTIVVPVQVEASDDVAVDRVALDVDGAVRGIDWSEADGWVVEVPCTAGAHTFTGWAYDAADNEASGSSRVTVRC